MFIAHLSPKESHPHDIVILTMLKDKAISRVLSDQSSMTLEEVLLYSKFNLEILTDINTELSTSWLLRAHTQVSTFSAVVKPQSQLVMFCQSTISLRVPPSATLSPQLETKDLTQDALEHMQLLLGTLMMDQEPELDFLQEPERPSLVVAELQSVLSQEEAETKSLL